MTREEAMFYIKELERLHASMDKKVAEAVDMAIEALSVDLVRCGECKHGKVETEPRRPWEGDITCKLDGTDREWYKEDYCSYGERDTDYEQAVMQLEHDMRYDPTYNPEDGSA